jgi:predicted transcriptional regulator
MALRENLQNEAVTDLPLRDPILVSPQTNVRAAIQRLRERQIGCAIVVDEAGKPLGFFTERTIIDLLLQKPDRLETLLVKDHLDPEYFEVSVRDTVCHVMDRVRRQGARFVCVVDEMGRAVALTGQKGLAEYIADHFPDQVMVQRVGGRPGQEPREGA